MQFLQNLCIITHWPSCFEAERCKLLYKEKCAMEKLCCEKQEVGEHENLTPVVQKLILSSLVSSVLIFSSSSTANLDSGAQDH